MTVKQLLSGYNPQVREICLHVRSLVRNILPEAEEIVFAGWKNISYGTGQSQTDKDLICYIAPFKDSVNLGFYRGTALTDEYKILRGSGKQLRHIKYTSLLSIDDVLTLDLLRQAKIERLG